MRHGRRALIVSACASLLTGCGSHRYSALGAASDALFNDLEHREITRDEAAKVPYASLGVRVDNEPERMAILAEARSDISRWSIGEDTTLLTRGPRIVGWYRADAVMVDRSDGDADPIALTETRPILPFECRRQLDFPHDGRYGVGAISSVADNGVQTISTISGPLAARLLVELGSAESVDWRFENRFYLDGRTGHWIASRQSIHPRMGSIELRVLRPSVTAGS